MKIGQNKVVEFAYELEVDGVVVDHTTVEKPLDYIHGTGCLLPKLEELIVYTLLHQGIHFLKLRTEQLALGHIRINLSSHHTYPVGHILSQGNFLLKGYCLLNHILEVYDGYFFFLMLESHKKASESCQLQILIFYEFQNHFKTLSDRRLLFFEFYKNVWEFLLE